jgi:hypothetical protein
MIALVSIFGYKVASIAFVYHILSAVLHVLLVPCIRSASSVQRRPGHQISYPIFCHTVAIHSRFCCVKNNDEQMTFMLILYTQLNRSVLIENEQPEEVLHWLPIIPMNLRREA